MVQETKCTLYYYTLINDNVEKEDETSSILRSLREKYSQYQDSNCQPSKSCLLAAPSIGFYLALMGPQLVLTKSLED